MILIYYTVLSLAFSLGGSSFADSEYEYDNPLNSSEIQDSEVDTGGIFGTGISFTRFLGLVLIGVGLPSDTPIWFALMFASWQIIILILTVGFIISSIWNG